MGKVAAPHGGDEPSGYGEAPQWPDFDDTIDMKDVHGLFLNVLLRAVHDACGNCIDLLDKPGKRLDTAQRAWTWLHSPSRELRTERHDICALAGIDSARFERALAMASIPYPTEETVLQAFLHVETAIWRMKGGKGPAPKSWSDGGQSKPGRATFNSVQLRRINRPMPIPTIRQPMELVA